MVSLNSTILRNGNKIMGFDEDMFWNSNSAFALKYDKINADWRFA